MGPKQGKKAKISKKRILKAARQVFAVHPFQEATLRMIGKQGGFEHPLIHYYFPSKSDLFEAVIKEITEELILANTEWFKGLDGKDVIKDLATHLDRILEYNLINPEPFKIIFLNMSQVHILKDIPGIQMIPLILAGTRENLKSHISFSGSEEEIIYLNSAFANIIVWYLGANHCQAMVLGLDPLGREYREWVKNAIMSIFIPLANKIVI